MAQRSKAKAQATKRSPAKRSRPARAARRAKATEPAVDVVPVPPTETAEQALIGIAQDAVVILRRELACQAARSLQYPGTVKMKDLVAMLRLLVDLVPQAMKGTEGQAVSYEALTPDEQAQLAALLSKVATA